MAAVGYAVVDVETTGFSPKRGDRIVEIAIVHVSPEGEIEGSWETLVNPLRDVGPTRIHGITATHVAHAPTFPQIGPRVLNLLSGRVLVAHNAEFDTRFLFHELAGVDGDLALEVEDSITFATICTMQLASEYFPGSARTLAACCAAASIHQNNAHRALGDAEATARLLAHYHSRSRHLPYWPERLGSARSWKFDESKSPEWVPREFASAPRRHFLERIAVGVEAAPESSTGRDLDYLGLLDRVLIDGHLSSVEEDALVEVAAELGLDRADIERLNLDYFDRIAAIAWSDGELTVAELAELLSFAAILNIDDAHVTSVTSPTALERVAPATPGQQFELVEGDIVVLTGEMAFPRSVWESHLASKGLVVAGGVSKKVKVVAAADPESRSGKASKAHDLGIAVISEAKLVHLVGEPA